MTDRKLRNRERKAAAARAAYETADTAYRAALVDATGPGGSFDPRSAEAQRAEELRVEMLAARSTDMAARCVRPTTYPRVEGLIPKSPPRSTVIVGDIAPKVSAALKITGKKREHGRPVADPVRLVSGGMTVVRDKVEVFDADLPTTGDALEVAFSASFLADALAVVGTGLVIDWTDSLKPHVFRGSGPVRALVMPTRL